MLRPGRVSPSVVRSTERLTRSRAGIAKIENFFDEILFPDKDT